MKLIFEMGATRKRLDLIPPCTTPEVTVNVPMRKKALHLPEVSETELSRHYTDLAKQTHGSTMVSILRLLYHEIQSEDQRCCFSSPGFTNIHPLQDTRDVQGCLEVLSSIEKHCAKSPECRHVLFSRSRCSR